MPSVFTLSGSSRRPKRPKRRRRGGGLSGATDAEVKRAAQDSYWDAKRHLDEAKHLACPRRADHAMRARAQALRSAGLFSRLGDKRSMVISDDAARDARRIADSCGAGHVYLGGAGRRRKKRARR